MKRSLNFKDISNDEFSDDEEEISFSLGHKKRNIWFFQLIFSMDLKFSWLIEFYLDV